MDEYFNRKEFNSGEEYNEYWTEERLAIRRQLNSEAEARAKERAAKEEKDQRKADVLEGIVSAIGGVIVILGMMVI